MKLLDKLLLEKYIHDKTRYELSRYIAVILIFLSLLFTLLLFFDNKPHLLFFSIPSILIVTILSMVLLKLGYLRVATIFSLFALDVLATAMVFSISHRSIYEIYILATFQLSILFMATLITSNKRYTLVLSCFSITSFIAHFFLRGYITMEDRTPSNPEDYLIVSALILMATFLLTRIITQRENLTEEINKKLKESIESNKKITDAYNQLEALKETLVQSEKMRSIGILAAGMAHEINNPLGGIVQGSQAVSNRLKSNSEANVASAEKAGLDLSALQSFLKDRKIFRQLEFIKNSGIRASEIVNSILSFAGNSGQRSSHKISDIIEEALELVEKDYYPLIGCSEKDIEVVRNYTQDIPVIPCDSGKMVQVFLNIFKNGAEAMCGIMNKEKTEFPRFTVTIRTLQGLIKVEIKNNGPHIDQEIQKKIFDPFFTAKPEGDGRGLGLSVAYYIISETHGGSLTVESDRASGVNFIVELPLS